MTMSRSLLLCTAFAVPLLLGGCASNEELFAEYDAWCEGTVCLAPELHTEIVYIEREAQSMTWEPAVYFGYDLDSLAETEQARLDRNYEVLQSNPDLKISLQAFTDSVASFNYNVDLSNRRRDRVVDYLTGKGLDPNRIIASAGSELLPVLPSDSVEDRIINRRVEMMLLDSTGRPLSFGISRPSTEEFIPPYPIDDPDKL